MHRITDKQYKILVVLCEGNKNVDGIRESDVDLDQLLERVAYNTTKASMQFSIRALVKRGLITKHSEKRREALRTCYTPSKVAYQMMGYSGGTYLESSDVDLELM